MIEKLDLYNPERNYIELAEAICSRLNEVIDAVNPPVCFMCGNVITGNVKYHINDKVHCGCAQ